MWLPENDSENESESGSVMGVLRVNGGIYGIIEYLVHGRKQGQTLSRDELDERVVLYGDIEITAAIIGSMDVAGQKYLHVTFSVKERDLPVEKFREIDEFIREKLLAAYKEEELNVYSELQRPKMKNVLNKTTGAWHERLDHIHYVIPETNLITGKKENPVGLYENHTKFFEAIQELVNYKFSLASPKDNARVDVSHADVIARGKVIDTFKKGAFRDFKIDLINDIDVKEIKDYESFKEHLKSIGTLKITKAGKEGEYLVVKPFDKTTFINLREPEFLKSFFELPEAERAQTLGAGHAEKKSSRMRPKQTEAKYEELVQQWVDVRSKEVRYLNSGSPTYKKYYAKDATPEVRAEILAYYEQRAHAQRNNLEKQYDDQYREQGRTLKRGRDAVARDSGERIFAERAEQQALARAMGNDTKPGLAVSTLGEAPKFGDSMRSLSQGDVAGEQRRTPVLVHSDARNDMEAGRPVAAGNELQRAGGSTGRINPATGRTSDTATAQMLRDEQEAQRQETGNRQPTINDIKKELKAQRLLAELAGSHKLRPEDYEIHEAISGDRIRHVGGHHGDEKQSKVRYNVSDFLTKHMHLSWGEAQPYLAACYDRQKNGVPIPKVASKANRDLHAEFQEYRRNKETDEPGYLKQDWQRQLASERARKSVITDRFNHEKARIEANPNLSEMQKKGLKRVALANKVDDILSFEKAKERERAELNDATSDTEQYRLWLQGEAYKRQANVLRELRKQSTEPETDNKLFKSFIAAVDDNQPDAGKWLEDKALLYRVERNGDVTYIRDGHELLLDTSRKVS